MLLRDFFRPSDELLHRGFVHDKIWAVELKQRLDNPSIREVASMAPDGKLVCSVAHDFPIANKAKYSGSINLDGSISGSVAYNVPTLPWLTVTPAATVKLQKRALSDASLEVAAQGEVSARGRADVRAKYNVLQKAWSGSIGGTRSLRSGATLGVAVDASGKQDLTNLKNTLGVFYGMHVKSNIITLTGKVGPHSKSPFGVLCAALHSRKTGLDDAGSQIGAEFTYIVPEQKVEMSLGGCWALDTPKKATILKAKLNHEGKIFAAVTHKLSEDFSLTLGAEFDCDAQAPSERKAAGFGLKLNLMGA